MKKLMLAILVGLAGNCYAVDYAKLTTATQDGITPPTADELSESHPRQRRWLSVPKSRLVLNPYNFLVPTVPVEPCADTVLPLGAGYYAGGTALRFESLLQLHAHTDGEPTELLVGHTDDLCAGSDGWVANDNATVNDSDGKLRLTVHGPMTGCPTCGPAKRRVEVDLDRHPWLEVTVDEIGDAWALKVSDDSSTREITLQRDTTTTGTFAYNVAEEAGWSGRKNVEVFFYVIGKEKPGVLSSLRFLGVETAFHRAGDACSTEWAPHVLTAEATYGDAGTVHCTDVFADENSTVRELRLPKGNAVWTLAGHYQGSPTWDADRRMLTVESTTATYAIALRGEVKVRGLQYYRTSLELSAGGGGQTDPHAREGIWALDFQRADEGKGPMVCGIGFAPATERASIAQERALAASRQDLGELVAKQRNWWNDYLAAVPHLKTNFGIGEGVDPLGLLPEQVRAEYYRVWVFLAANSLPVMPETGFNYPQVPAGKASMWLEGHPKARPTASWDSLFAMQLQAYTDPELAWDAFEGLITLVDPDGRLGGESLPSRKAQTALVLYEKGGQIEKLRAVYPALKRHLLWERENPRWIHKEHDFKDEKDADFVVSLILDMRWMERIAEILQRDDEKKFWQAEADRLFADYEKWFWETPDADPIQVYFTESGQRRQGNGLWVLSGLALPDLKDGSRHMAGMWRVFEKVYKPKRTFGGFFLPKHPEMQLLVLGLHQRGRTKEALEIANIAIRDVTRANMFAEQYDIDDFPNPDGVRPSAFGAAMLVEMLWLRERFREELNRGK